MKTQWQNNWST